MYRTIIVPIDLSQEQKGRDALDTALKLGGGEAEIVLVTVLEEIPAYVSYEIPAGLMEESRREAAGKLAAITADVDAKVETAVLTGHPANEILDFAEARNADLVIIASHRPGMRDYFIGSTAGRVVRHALCSVLVTR